MHNASKTKIYFNRKSYFFKPDRCLRLPANSSVAAERFEQSLDSDNNNIHLHNNTEREFEHSRGQIRRPWPFSVDFCALGDISCWYFQCCFLWDW